MKQILFAAALLASAVVLADRTDVWLSSSVSVSSVMLTRLVDGGCAVQAHASFSKSDGGMVGEASRATEVSGANRTSCLDILDTKAPVLFKSDKGL